MFDTDVAHNIPPAPRSGVAGCTPMVDITDAASVRASATFVELHLNGIHNESGEVGHVDIDHVQYFPSP